VSEGAAIVCLVKLPGSQLCLQDAAQESQLKLLGAFADPQVPHNICPRGAGEAEGLDKYDTMPILQQILGASRWNSGGEGRGCPTRM